MSDQFTPLDLSKAYNAGSGNGETEDGYRVWPASDETPDNTPLVNLPWGECKFWGVPFSLGEEGADQSIVLVAQKAKDGIGDAARIVVKANARRVLFAHACAPVEGERVTVEGTGEAIGTYRVVYADGSAVEQLLRRRFEVHDVQIPWGHHPFLCRNCRNYHAEPLNSRAQSYGLTQTGAFTRDGNDMQGWWLYDWENPEPDKEIATIEVSAASSTALALAGITLCHEASDPFSWPARQEVAIRVDAEGAPEVEMQRGEVVRQDTLFVRIFSARKNRVGGAAAKSRLTAVM